jgi:hypothetical protein
LLSRPGRTGRKGDGKVAKKKKATPVEGVPDTPDAEANEKDEKMTVTPVTHTMVKSTEKVPMPTISIGEARRFVAFLQDVAPKGYWEQDAVTARLLTKGDVFKEMFTFAEGTDDDRRLNPITFSKMEQEFGEFFRKA